MKSKIYALLLFSMAIACTTLMAQQNPPANVTATALSHESVKVSWSAPQGTTQPLRINLWNQSQMVIYPGGGYGNNDVSCSYGGQTILGRNINETAKYKVGDDFTLPTAAHISTIDFYAYQTGSSTTSTFTGAFVSIYDSEPVDSTSVPIWTSGPNNVMTSAEWTGIYRTSATALNDTTRPIMRVTTAIDTTLPAGTYWVTVSMTGSLASGPWCPPVSIPGMVSTGNGIQLVNGVWQAWSDDTSLEQLGVPFVVKGSFVSENLMGFNIYRDNVLLNTSIIESFDYTDEGLTMETPYCYTVEAVYTPGGTATSDPVCVTTQPDPCSIYTLPYTENFDDYGTGTGTFPTCWTKYYSGSTTTYPYCYSTYNYSAPASLYMYASTAYYDIASTPRIDSNIQINTLRASMMLRKGGANYKVIVGTITNPHDGSTFHPYDTLSPTATSVWEPFEVNFDNYTGNDHYIAFKCGDMGAVTGMYIDNFVLQYIPTCEQPVNLTYAPQDEQIVISWTPRGNETLWNISYMFSDETDWTTVYGVTDSSYVIQNLTPSTDYELIFKVQTDCGAGDESLWTSENIVFTTQCEAVTIPYEETFDSYGTGTGTYVPCWNRGGYSSTTSEYPYLSSTYSFSSPAALYFYGTSSTPNWITTPKINGNISDYEVSFKLRKTSAAYKLEVGVMTNPNDVSTFVPLDTLSPQVSSEWENFLVSLAPYTGNGKYIAFKTPTGSANYMYLDNVVVDYPHSCVYPAGFHAENITTNSADFVWSSVENVTSYNLTYKLESDSVWTSVDNISDTTYQLSGLLDGQDYQVRVSSNCPDGTNSFWSDILNIQTYCLPISTLPYTENFDSYGTGSSAFPTCFTKYNTLSTSNYPYINTTYYSAPGALYFYSTSTYADGASLPAIDNTLNMQDLQVSFKARKASAAYKLVVGVMTDPLDPTTFESLDTISPDAVSTWQTFDIPLSNYTGTGRHISFRTGFTITSGMYIDDVVVDYIPACIKPYDLTFTDVQTNSLTASWTNGNSGSSSLVQYKSKYEEQWTEITVTDTFVVISNLTPNTPYEVRVSAICGDGTQSSWTDIKTVNTGCGIISTFPYHEYFDTYGTGTGTMPTCWTKNYSGTISTYPYINTTNASAPGSLYMYAASTYYVIAATPEIDSTIGLNQLQLSFMARKSSAAYSLIVGAMSDPTDLTTFVPLDTISPEATSTWEQYDLTFPNYTGNAHHFAFRSGSGSAANTIYLDNVVIDYIPNCFRPSDVTASHYVQNGVTISWTPGADESAWNVAYMAETDSVWTELYSVTDTFYQFSSLEANTTYLVKVQSDCGNEVSEYTYPISFTTLCTAIDSLPFAENFESYSTGAANFPACWTRMTNSATNYPYVNSTAHNSSRALYFYRTTSTYCYAVLPEIDASIDLDDLMLSFYSRKSIAAAKLEVGIMTDPYDPATFQLITQVSPSEISVFEEKNVFFTGYTGTGRFIAFRVLDGAAASVYVDDVVLDYAPDCLEPQMMTVSNIMSSSAMVTWASPEEINTWDIVYGPAGFDITTGTIQTLGDSYFELTGLTASTQYDVYVRAICTEGPTEWVSTSFSTSCLPISEFPYVEDFDNYGTGTTVFPACWTKISNATSAPYVYSTTASTGLTLPGALYFYTTSATTYQYAIMPEMDANISDLQIDLAFKAAMGNVHHVDIGVMTDANDTSTFELIETIEPITSVWNGFTVPFTSYTGTGKFIAFRVLGVTTCYVDHIIVDYVPGCVMPHNLVVDSLTTTTADVSWIPGHNETEWIVSYGPVGYFPNTSGTSTTVTQTSFQIAGLDPATTYDFYVKAICSADETSDWSNKCTFQTNCLMIDSLPYMESFDDYGTGTTAFPTCWNRYSSYITTTRYPYISTTHSSGVGSLYFYSTSTTHTIAATPEFDPSIDINTLRATFKMYKSSASYHLKVGVMTDPTDISTFVELADLTPSTTSSWEEFSVNFDTYTGNGHFIAFVSNGASNYMYLDDVMIQYIPTCEAPVNLHLTDIGLNTATVAWEVADSLGVSWEVEYGPAGFNLGAGTTISATTPSVALTGLTTNTAYDVYVKQICGPGDESIHSHVFSFSTLCDPISTLPYQENFDQTTGSTTGTVNNLPNCWDFYNNGTISTYAGYPIVYNSSTYASSTPNAIRFYTYTSTSYGDQVLIFPALNTTTYPLNTIQLSFDARSYLTSSTYNFLLYVGVVSDLTDITTFVPTDTINVTSTAYSTFTTTFENYSGTGANIVLWAPHLSGATYNVGYVDNIVIEEIPCETPTNLQVGTITSTSAVVTWTPAGNESAWNVAYRETTGSTWVTQTASVPSVTLSNLSPETSYSVRVQADCGNSQSDWSEIEIFSTLAAPNCPTPSSLQVATEGTTATFIWMQEPNTANEWELWYRPLGGTYQMVTTNVLSYTLQGLTLDVTYEAYVIAHCTNGVNSDPSSVVTFTPASTPTCPSPTNLTADVANTDVTLTWQQETGTANMWQINYRQTTENTWSTATATATTYTLTDLVANVDYEANVVAICNNGLTSDASNTVSFHTTNVGIANYLETSVNLYPNPATEMVMVEVNDANIHVARVEVFNVYGQLIHTIVSSENPLRINISALADGMYYVRVTTDSGVVTKNFVKK